MWQWELGEVLERLLDWRCSAVHIFSFAVWDQTEMSSIMNQMDIPNNIHCYITGKSMMKENNIPQGYLLYIYCSTLPLLDIILHSITIISTASSPYPWHGVLNTKLWLSFVLRSQFSIITVSMETLRLHRSVGGHVPPKSPFLRHLLYDEWTDNK